MLALDAKGRLSIPARYRAELEEQSKGRLVVTVQRHGKSLLIYPEPDFEEAAHEVRKLSDFEPSEQRFKYLFIGHAMDMDIDSNGRVLVPPVLRTLVGVEKQVALVGMTNKFELWDEDAWLQQQRGLYISDDGAAVSERLKGLSI
ncbi:MAG: division/cell wall cluster transcriptional repressor MraZ [Pseudomonadales bacterium]|jgi:MraZ protein|nr:division/cell wall cluster transcriptional repressor MraZ [Pseudomonadales bacterium]